MSPRLLAPFLAFTTVQAAPTAISLLPDAVTPTVADVQAMQVPDRVHLTGWLGGRIAVNESARLARMDTDRLLEGYVHRPGRQAWEGEHVGKWLHAATLAWANTGDPELRRRLDQVAATLASCQLEDGYLGTYLPADRWTEWDVWSHKYNILGLLTYMRHTGNRAPLDTCRRMADLLCREFGEAPGQRDIVRYGHHVGMASLSVLEPMALLHRFTGEPRYLEFCRYLVRASEQAHGPRIISTLEQTGRVNLVGNGKAYEMLSCLNGLLELYRTTGDTVLLQACLRAWDDIVARRLHLTGAASSRELFRADDEMPNVGDVGETCVTVTWLQFNAQLLRLTGEARFAEQLERVVLNQLLGAQQPDGTAWGYYVQMQSFKPYSASLTGHCCLSSGPRGLALVPTFAATTDADGVVINLIEAGEAQLALAGGGTVSVAIDTSYPVDGHARILLRPDAPREFTLRLRVPAWAAPATVRAAGAAVPAAPGTRGYAEVRRTWAPGDSVDLDVPLATRVVAGTAANQGRVALMHGPLVLALDESLLPAGAHAAHVCVPSADLATLHPTVEPATGPLQTWEKARVWRVDGGIRRTSGATTTIEPARLGLVPFADAGCAGAGYQVWLPLEATLDPHNLLLEGNVEPAPDAENLRLCADGELGTVAILRPVESTKPVSFTITLPRAMTVARVSFAHGMVWGLGGWFDTSAGSPRVQVQRTRGGPWEDVGSLADYPATTAAEGSAIARDLRKDLEIPGAELARRLARHTYNLTLDKPRDVVAVRVSGYAARPTGHKTGVLTCAELQAFGP